MSLPQDSMFDACYKCYLSVSSNELIKCIKCASVFHKNCAEVIDVTVETWLCQICTEQVEEPSKENSQQVQPPNQVSQKAKSIRSSASSKSSSSILQMKLKVLEEKQKIMERQHNERELQLKEKHRQENEIIELKLSILKDCCDHVSIDVEEQNSAEKVSGWLQKTDTRVSKDCLQKDSVVPPTSTDVNNTVNQVTYVVPKHSSTGNHPSADNIQQKLVFQPKPIEASGTNGNPLELQATSFDSSVIAARHVVGRKLPLFDGNPLQWPSFLATFKNSTQICRLTDAENLLRLSDSLKGDAYTAVRKLLYMPDNVSYIIEILGNVFGRPEYIINALLEDIRTEPKPKYEVFDSIIAFSLQVNNLCATMKSSLMSDYLWNPLLMQELVEKLPTQMKFEWAIYKTATTSAVNLETFNSWLETKAVSLTSVLSRPPQLSKYSKPSKGFLNFHASNEQTSCVICLKQCENITLCPAFLEANYSEKWNYIKNHNICRICLRKHQGRCRSGKKCEIVSCPYKHHTLLHKPTQANRHSHEEESDINLDEANVNHHNEISSTTLFKVVPVNLYGKDQMTISTYAFLDEGSSVTLIDSSIADELQLTGNIQPLCLRWTNNRSVTDYKSKKISVSVGSVTGGKRFFMENVRTIQSLELPYQSLNVEELRFKYSHLKNLPVQSFINIQPRILIGLDNVQLCSSNKIRTGKINEPVAGKTVLGWSIYGHTIDTEKKYNLHICECENLTTTVRNFISFDNLIVKEDCQLTKLDQKAIKSMENSIRFINDRYECGILWRFDTIDLPESLEMAKRRSTCLIKRLQKDPQLHKSLDMKIDDYIKKSYARKLTLEEISQSSYDHWYLPVFPVVNPNKPGKLRLVWDAAAKSHGVSLNDFLYKGPDLLNSLPGILLRFRENKIGLAGDIMEMFHQIKLLETEQKYHRFLWQRQNENLPSTYAMTVMSFGAACSPCISQFVKNHHASKYSKIYPRAVIAIQKNHYVDDWIDSFKTEKEAVSVSSEVFKILSSGGFIMRNWISNYQELSKTMGDPAKSQKDISEADNHTEKVLGMFWETSSDVFRFSLKYNKGNSEILEGLKLPTKRQLLRIMMSVFDPLGLVAHIIVYCKILLQRIWERKIMWDDTISDCFVDDWKKWILTLQNIQYLRIPRWYSPGMEDCEYELHTFVDGSEQAFAALVYIRCIQAENICCQLASAKTRTAPLKPLSIPRLELQSAVLGARLAKFVQDNQSIKFKRRVFWTDSKTVMCWLRSEPRKFKQFVTCRLGEILDLSTVEEWRWIPTGLNPADMGTRMKVPTQEMNSIWYNGPSFLTSCLNEVLDEFESSSISSEAEKELRPHVMFHHFVIENLIDVEKFSTYRRLRRRYFFVLWCFLTWKNKLLNSTELSVDTTGVYKLVDNLLIRQAQNEVYNDEIASLMQGKLIEKSSNIFKCSPYIDGDNILRSKGRIDYAPDVLQNTKRPAIMPPGHPLTRLIIDRFHQRLNHKNHETVINELRQEFSISRLRSELKKVISICQHCKNEKASPSIPEEAPLPPARLSSFTRPFTYTGIDFFGPIHVTIGRKSEKRWGLIATCLTIRAIHIELASSLTTSSCVLALRNFMNRRGRSKEIYCDNGTNFRGASRELTEAMKGIEVSKIHDEFTDYEIKWFFNPPAAPHMGGSWERLIRSIKSNLYAITSTRTLKEEILRSLLIEIENIINSRPLTYIPIEDENSEALTPNHFLVGSSNGNKPIGQFSDKALVLRNHWTISQKLTDIFWKRWVCEYLPTLVRRTKWFTPVKPVEVGDIVIVFEDNLPRSCYPKGRIISTFKGRDGLVRKVTVRTIKGIIQRPVSKIAVLDILNKRVAEDTQHLGGEMLRSHPVSHHTIDDNELIREET